jgi:hypothetical protein
MASEIFYHLTGGAANADPDLSLGGDTSSEVLSSTALNNLFDNVAPDEIESADLVEYRAIEIQNDGDALAKHIQFYLTDTPNAESLMAVWYDSTGTQSIVNETTEPTGASGNWSLPLVGSKMSLGDLAAGAGHRMWIRRTVDQDAVNINEDTAILHTWAS